MKTDNNKAVTCTHNALIEAANQLEELARNEIHQFVDASNVDLYRVARLVNKSLALRSYAQRIKDLNY